MPPRRIEPCSFRHLFSKKISDKWYSPDARRFGTSKGQPRWFKTVTEYPDQYVNPSECVSVPRARQRSPLTTVLVQFLCRLDQGG